MIVSRLGNKGDGVVVSHTNITERKLAEAGLHQTNERLKKVLEVETVGVVFFEMPSGVMMDANDSFLKLMGYSRRQVEARELTWQKLTPPEFMPVSLEEIRKFEVTGRLGPYEKQYLREDGTRQGASVANSAAVRPRFRRGTETILLVEDESSVRRITRMLLERQGYTLIEAANGVDALQLWKQHREAVALLLTDLVMPGGITGQQLARELLADKPTLRIVFTSGYSAEIAGGELHLSSGENFLQKPCPPALLLETIRRALES